MPDDVSITFDGRRLDSKEAVHAWWAEGDLDFVPARDHAPVTVADLKRSAGVFADLDDPDVMGGAWS